MSISVGDTVVISWTTPSGVVREYRGCVIDTTPTKVVVEYVRESVSGRSLSTSIRTRALSPEQVRKVEKNPDELAPQEYMRALVYRLAGKELPG